MTPGALLTPSAGLKMLMVLVVVFMANVLEDSLANRVMKMHNAGVVLATE